MGGKDRIILAALAAIGALAATFVFAKDRPPPPRPSRVTGCEGMGPGFVKLEGSDTCVKVSGSLRFDVGASTSRPDVFSTSGH